MPFMPDAPVLSLESVNALVPRLNVVIREQMGRRAILEAKLAALTTLLGNAPDGLEPDEGDSSEVARLKVEAHDLVVAYRQGWSDIEELGAVVKDPRRGLLDFYGRVEGELVWLCWQYGESEVSHYHRLEEGFPGRKEIARAVKQRLLN
jgi:hypothetical protein